MGYSRSFMGVIANPQASAVSVTQVGTNTLLDVNTFDRPVQALRIGEDKAMVATIDTGRCNVFHITRSGTTLSSSTALVPSNDTNMTTDYRLADFGFDPNTGHVLLAMKGSGSGDVNLCSIETSGTNPTEIGTFNAFISDLATLESIGVCYLGSGASGSSWFAVAIILNQFSTPLLRVYAVKLNSSGAIQSFVSGQDITLDTSLSTTERDAPLQIKIGCPAEFKVVIPVQGGICHVATFDEGTGAGGGWTDNGEISGLVGSGADIAGTSDPRSSKVGAFTDIPVMAGNGNPSDYTIKWVNSSGAYVAGSESTSGESSGDAFSSGSVLYQDIKLGLMPDGTTRCAGICWRDFTTTDTVFAIYKMDTNTSFAGTADDKDSVEVASSQSAHANCVQMSNDYWAVLYRNDDNSNRLCGLLYEVTGG